MRISEPIAKRLSFRSLGRVFRQASSEWIADNATRLGASVAFYTLLSLAPLIVIVVAIGAFIYGKEAAQGRLAWEIKGMAGPEVARTLEEIIKSAYRPGTSVIATLLGLAALMFGASSVFVELHDAMNTIWGVRLPRERTHTATLLRLIGDRFYSFVAVLSIGFLLLISLGFNAWSVAMGISLPPAAIFTVSYFLVAALFAALYKIVPDVVLQWRDVALGAAITALLLMIGKQFLELYFANTSFGSTYSAVGSPVVVLLWVYYSAQLFFWGAEFSKVYAKTIGSQRGGAVITRPLRKHKEPNHPIKGARHKSGMTAEPRP